MLLPRWIALGFPCLPDPAGQSQIALLQSWLRMCDEGNGHACNPPLEGPLPSRVIDVGTESNPVLKLHCTTCSERTRYLALSHRWGSPPAHEAFYTTRRNFAKFRQNIKPTDLPATFKDAVRLTRLLGVRYLWIDSLCIIQDDDEDWHAKSREMEDVYWNAYCVIAASRARGNSDGFLHPKLQRKVVPMRTETGDTYYICENIDKFKEHVIDGELNQRGWVLQERALAHRTIFFTDRQVYWECGNGVQCETLTAMRK